MCDNQTLRCRWVNHDIIYINYHDYEWGIPVHDDQKLFEMLLLESFHVGLSWYIILKKRDSFKSAFDEFDMNMIAQYDEKKVLSLLENKNIIRHKGKIAATISNAKSFIEIQKEFGSFNTYIWMFTENKILDIYNSSHDEFFVIAKKISSDMKRRGFKFLGAITIQAYLEAVGIISNHSEECFLYNRRNEYE